jgi:hypothetical protein
MAKANYTISEQRNFALRRPLPIASKTPALPHSALCFQRTLPTSTPPLARTIILPKPALYRSLPIIETIDRMRASGPGTGQRSAILAKATFGLATGAARGAGLHGLELGLELLDARIALV